jgi:hypothetical protein
MPSPSPYRSLSPERRVALVTHALKSSREARALYTQRFMSRGGGFRAVTLNAWSADKLAREIVRMKAEQPQDEADLLRLLYIELEPAIQITFLDAAGVTHTNGVMAEDLLPPFADEPAVRRAAKAALDQHSAEAARYLRTLSRYTAQGWPGIEAVVQALGDVAPAAVDAGSPKVSSD